MNSASLDPQSNPGFVLWRLGSVWRKRAQEVLVKHGLTHPQFVLLACISEFSKKGEKPTQIRLAEYCGMDAATVSQVVRNLEEKGFICRKPLNGDQRAKALGTLEKGRTALAEAWPSIHVMDRAFMKSEKQDFVGFIQALRLTLNL
ncbi:MAG: MarR family transcriptional regulator [Opitutales bacterium]|tara:strand:- start:278 stop:715 length:438 start_codon:yes stop_codon:yes gene_type:complete